MEKQKIAIVGCGKLAKIIAGAVRDGLLCEYELVGVLSRSPSSAQALSDAMGGKVCQTLDELLALHPDYVVETASPAALREIAEPVLTHGANLVTLSIGAFADADFYGRAAQTAQAHGTRIYIASGAVGGFDVLRTAALMSGLSASITTEKGPESLRGTSVFEEGLLNEKKEVFRGSAKEAIALFPTKVNVAVAASLASAGPEQMRVSINSTPGFVGDDHRIEVEGDEVHAVVDIYSKTSAIAGWSIVSLLKNLVSPIVFQ